MKRAVDDASIMLVGNEYGQMNTNSSVISAATTTTPPPILIEQRVPSIHDLIDDVVARINFGFMLFGIIGNFLCILVLMQKSLLKRKFNW